MDDFLQWAMCRVETGAGAERRPHRRRRVAFPGFIVYDDGQGLVSCTIRDISPSGARIAFGRVPLFPDDVHLIEIPARLVHEARVIWLTGYQAGLSFTRSLKIETIVEPPLAFLKQLWQEHIAA